MPGARGAVEAEVGGKRYKLRVSLAAIDKIEIHTEKGFLTYLQELNDEKTTKLGGLLYVFGVLADAGGNPLSQAEREGFIPTDLPELTTALGRAMAASGLMKEEESPQGNAEAEAQTASPKSPGENGSE